MESSQTDLGTFKPEFTIDSIDADHRITDPSEIEFLGNNVMGWKLSTDSIANRIEKGYAKFVVFDKMQRKMLDVTVLTSKEGKRILRAISGNRTFDTLLGLPRCSHCRLID